MPVNPADQAVRLAVSDILSKFYRNDRSLDTYFSELAVKVNEIYRPSPLGYHALGGLLLGRDELQLRDNGLFLFLEPVADKGLLPLLTLQTSSEWINFRAYVLLTMLDESGELQSLAIRFETDEGSSQANGKIGSHDFCHAQLCRSVGAMRTSTPNWIPESQPSFPLDADDQVGLVLCMLTSLYGGRHVVERLRQSGLRQSGGRSLRQHLVRVRALT